MHILRVQTNGRPYQLLGAVCCRSSAADDMLHSMPMTPEREARATALVALVVVVCGGGRPSHQRGWSTTSIAVEARTRQLSKA